MKNKKIIVGIIVFVTCAILGYIHGTHDRNLSLSGEKPTQQTQQK
jgi:hypothetical protein